jgi:hypothetical protein
VTAVYTPATTGGPEHSGTRRRPQSVCLGKSSSRPLASARAIPAVCRQHQQPPVSERRMAQSTGHVMIRDLISRDLHRRRWRTWERGVGSCGGGDARNDSSGGARLTQTGVAGKGSCFQVWRVDKVTEVWLRGTSSGQLPAQHERALHG